MVERAIILAAGMGSRLRPLTDSKPKALLEYQGRTMLEHVVERITEAGINKIIINVHHHAEMVMDFIKTKQYSGFEIEFSDERDLLMDTGGGILKARWFLDQKDPFLVHNIDIYSDFNLHDLFDAHISGKSLATLAVSDRETSRNLLVDENNLLCGWRNNTTGESIIVHQRDKLKGVAFSGIHVIDPGIFKIIDREDPFPMTNAYLELAENYPIQTWDHTGSTWVDMAHRSNFAELN